MSVCRESEKWEYSADILSFSFYLIKERLFQLETFPAITEINSNENKFQRKILTFEYGVSIV